MSAATSGLPGRRRDFLVQRQAKARRCQRRTVAQATRRVLLEDSKLVAKREDLRLQGSTGSKTGGYESEKGDEKRAHRGSHHDLTNGRNPCVFRSDGVFGMHSRTTIHVRVPLESKH